MGSITFQISSTAPAITANKTFSVPDAHIARLAVAMKTNYGQVVDASVVPQTVPPTMRDRTNAEALSAMLSGVMQGWVNAVQQVEQQTAASTAVAGVAPITAT